MYGDCYRLNPECRLLAGSEDAASGQQRFAEFGGNECRSALPSSE